MLKGGENVRGSPYFIMTVEIVWICRVEICLRLWHRVHFGSICDCSDLFYSLFEPTKHA